MNSFSFGLGRKKFYLSASQLFYFSSFLCFFFAYLASERKFVDFFLPAAWYFFSFQALQSLFTLLRAPKKITLIGYFLLILIFFLDFNLRAFLETNWGKFVPYSTFFLASLETNPAEASEFFHFYGKSVALFSFFFLASTVFLCWLRWKLYTSLSQSQSTFKKKFIWVGVWVLLHFQPHTNAEPFLFYRELGGEFYQNYQVLKNYQQMLLKNAALLSGLHVSYEGEKAKNTVIWVIGESSTSLNWQIYGYPRPTNPLLKERMKKNPQNYWVFQNVFASHASTALMLRSFLTLSNRHNENLFETSADLVSIAKAAGYKVFWFSNHYNIGIHNNYAASVANLANEVFFSSSSNSEDAKQRFDVVLLPFMQKALKDSADKKFIIFHIFGSHMVYKERYPSDFSYFDASQDQISKKMKALGREESVIVDRNTYDNSILYTDWILDHFLTDIQAEEKEPRAFLYLSNHGEEVGHISNRVGHANDTTAGVKVPLVVWANSLFPPLNKPPSINKEKREKEMVFSDDIEQSLLHLLQIKIDLYDPKRDIFNDQYLAPTQPPIKNLSVH